MSNNQFGSGIIGEAIKSGITSSASKVTGAISSASKSASQRMASVGKFVTRDADIKDFKAKKATVDEENFDDENAVRTLKTCKIFITGDNAKKIKNTVFESAKNAYKIFTDKITELTSFQISENGDIAEATKKINDLTNNIVKYRDEYKMILANPIIVSSDNDPIECVLRLSRAKSKDGESVIDPKFRGYIAIIDSTKKKIHISYEYNGELRTYITNFVNICIDNIQGNPNNTQSGGGKEKIITFDTVSSDLNICE